VGLVPADHGHIWGKEKKASGTSKMTRLSKLASSPDYKKSGVHECREKERKKKKKKRRKKRSFASKKLNPIQETDSRSRRKGKRKEKKKKEKKKEKKELHNCNRQSIVMVV
jgi:hypothetical protein